jgi:hypothetical protein
MRDSVLSERRQDSPPGAATPKLRTQNSAFNTRACSLGRACGDCACVSPVWNGRRDWLLCANYPGHEGELTHVSGTGIVVDCRKFRARRDVETPPAEGEAVRHIPLGAGRVAIVDAADFEWLNQYKWRAFGKGDGLYAVGRVGGKVVFMHRLIMDPPAGMMVDHINGNEQDNRRCNLRICTPAQNARNSRKKGGASRFKGAYWYASLRKWVAKICHNGKTTHLGWFDNEIDAASAYDRAARRLFGEFACLNFPESENIVWLSGRICVRSHAGGRVAVTARYRCHGMSVRRARMAPRLQASKYEIRRAERFGPGAAGLRRLEREAHSLQSPSRMLVSDSGFSGRHGAAGIRLRVSRGPPLYFGNHALKVLAWTAYQFGSVRGATS